MRRLQTECIDITFIYLVFNLSYSSQDGSTEEVTFLKHGLVKKALVGRQS